MKIKVRSPEEALNSIGFSFPTMNKKCPDCGSYNYEDGYCNECEGDGND